MAGLCASPSSPNVYEVETHAAGQPGEVNVVTRGGYYGWPAASASAKDALGVLPTKTGNPGGCAVLDGRLWVTSLDGRTLLSTTLRDSATPTLSTYVPVLTGTYGRLLTVVPAADGALWLTTANKDGGTPTAADDRVIRYPPSQVGGVTGQIK